MPDREKVIKGLEIHIKPNSRCVGCPYPNNGLCGDQLYHDALILLKEQKEKMEHLNNITLEYAKEVYRLQTLLKEREAVEPYVVNNNYEQHWKCGYCDSVVGVQDKYCRQCGRAVKWE